MEKSTGGSVRRPGFLVYNTLSLSLFLVSASSAPVGHTCIQDTLQAQRRAANFSEPRVELDYGAGAAERRRRLQAAPASSFEPIRIQTVFLGEARDGSGAVVTNTIRDYLRDHIVAAAVENWQAMLNVVRVSGRLYAARSCKASYTSAPLTGECGEYKTADDYFCGYDGSALNSDMAIPIGDYAGAQEYFTGACTSTTSTAGCTTATLPARTGVADADFVLFVTAVQTSNCPAQGAAGTLAYASTCQRDQNDRPTWGRVNFCPYALSTAPENLPLQIVVATHELNHALGFNSGSWSLWRNTDGSPRTRRFGGAQGGDPEAGFFYTCGGEQLAAAITDEATVAFSAERGMAKCSQPAGQDWTTAADFTLSNCVHRIVTPGVKAAARAHFGCADLAGGELENHLTTPCGSMGSHWEQRVLSTELMSSYVQHTSIVSALTLALHEDSGWYRANYEATTGVTVRNTWRVGDWGFQQGCDFAGKVCLDKSGGNAANTPPPTPVASSPKHFYNSAHSAEDGSAVCSTDRRFYGLVAVDHNDQNTPGVQRTSDIPSQYEYFTTAYYSSDAQRARLGGDLDAADYCPMAEPYSNSVCSHESNQNNANALGETFGTSSACFESTLVESDWQAGGRGAVCMPFVCSTDGLSLTVTLHRYKATSAAPTTITCDQSNKNTQIGAASIVGFTGTNTHASAQGTFTCPDPALLCADSVFVTLGDPASQTPAPRLPVASASVSPAAGTLSVYGALVFSKGSGAGVDSTAFASRAAVEVLANSIKAALADGGPALVDVVVSKEAQSPSANRDKTRLV